MSRDFGVRVVMILVLAAVAGCAAKPLDRPLPLGDPNTGPGSIAAARRYLEGRWTLVSMEISPPNETPIKVVGSGTIIYDEFANMDVQIRIDPETARQFERIGIAVPAGVFTTKGQTQVDMTTRTLRYVLEGEDVVRPVRHPLDIGLPRYWEVDGNTLTLRTKDPKGSVLSVSVWRKE